MPRKYDPEKKRAYYLANKERIKARLTEYRKSEKFKKTLEDYRNKPGYKEKIKGYNEKNKEYKKAYREKHKEELNRKERERYYATYEQNRAKKRESDKKFARNNPGKINAKTNKRRAAKLQRTPKWADLKAIEQFYENCPKGMVVDHIIPLQGKNVSGLHVLENLQYLTWTENSKKINKF